MFAESLHSSKTEILVRQHEHALFPVWVGVPLVITILGVLMIGGALLIRKLVRRSVGRFLAIGVCLWPIAWVIGGRGNSIGAVGTLMIFCAVIAEVVLRLRDRRRVAPPYVAR